MAEESGKAFPLLVPPPSADGAGAGATSGGMDEARAAASASVSSTLLPRIENLTSIINAVNIPPRGAHG
jgi:hypothetical protein